MVKTYTVDVGEDGESCQGIFKGVYVLLRGGQHKGLCYVVLATALQSPHNTFYHQVGLSASKEVWPDESSSLAGTQEGRLSRATLQTGS